MAIEDNSGRKVEYVKIAKEGPDKRAETIFTGLTYIAAILLIVFAIVPTFNTVKSIDKEIKEKERISAALKNKLETLSSLDEQYNNNKKAFEDITLIFPADENFSLLLANIEPIITRNSFVLRSVSFSKVKGSASEDLDLNTTVLVPYNVRINVGGNKSNLMILLKELESLPMYPVIEGISYSNKIEKDGTTNYSITLRVYNIEGVNFYE